ncbi:hypothetical protein RA269_27800, partial [Pseudomonas syringae pv. tagetis]
MVVWVWWCCGFCWWCLLFWLFLFLMCFFCFWFSGSLVVVCCAAVCHLWLWYLLLHRLPLW